jgi:hypothetical protein
MENGPLLTPSLSHFILVEVDIFGQKGGKMQKMGDVESVIVHNSNKLCETFSLFSTSLENQTKKLRLSNLYNALL